MQDNIYRTVHMVEYSYMKVFLTSDHAGFELKEALVHFLPDHGYTIEDMGPFTYEKGDDYPDYCTALAKRVAHEEGSLGIVIGYSGQGEAMASNRVKGARAAVYYGGKQEILTLSREHNDANILSIGAHFVSSEEATSAVLLWLSKAFSNEERHQRRIEKLDR